MRPLAAAGLGVVVVLALGGAAGAGDATPKPPPEGHLTISCTAVATALYSHADNGNATQDKITITFTETQEIKLTVPPSGYWTPTLVSRKTHVEADGGGRWSYDAPGPPPVHRDRTWTYAPRQLDDDREILEWECFGTPEHPEIKASSGWKGYIQDWTMRTCTCSDEGAGGPAVTTLVGGGLIDAKGEGTAGYSFRGTPKPLEYDFTFTSDPRVATEMAADRTYEYKAPDGTGTATYKVHYSFHFIPPGATEPEKPKVELQEIDRKWLPEESNSLTATVSVHGDKPATAFRFTLYDVSKEPGVCGNSEDANTDPDLSFAPDAGGWSVQQNGDQWTATSGNGGKAASVKIACHDWGAWGKLKAEAKIEDAWQPAKVAGTGLSYVRIPYDDDDDHIADSWQADQNVAGKAAKDDSGKKPTDQANDGDGLSVYEDYRGFSVLDANGGKTHVRLDPRQKVLFVLDKSAYFSPDVWQQSSGIKAYLLSDAMCKAAARPEAARRVNFRSSYAKNGDKYCVVIIVPTTGPYDDEDKDHPNGVTLGPGGGCPKSPREVESLSLYPGNMRLWLETVMRKQLETAMADSSSPDAQAFEKLGLPYRMWKDADDRLKNEAYLQKLVDQTMRQSAIHEMGHACGLMGHVDKSNPKAGEGFGLGNKSCPMYYAEHADDLKYIILQVLLKPDAAMPMAYGQFCKDADFNCWGHLNVKDN